MNDHSLPNHEITMDLFNILPFPNKHNNSRALCVIKVHLFLKVHVCLFTVGFLYDKYQT